MLLYIILFSSVENEDNDIKGEVTLEDIGVPENQEDW